MPLPLHEIEGKYEILKKIKEGGMGSIYKVRHLLLEQVRVIKVIKAQFSEDDSLQRRFHREARASIRLKHPNIAQLYDFSVDETGNAYIVMEFIDGVTMLEMLDAGGPLPIGLGLELARQSLRALSYLHQRGYVHRDISPDNIMVTRDHAGQPLAKLIDLGIIKHIGGENVDLTGTGMFLGKVRYAAPELFTGGQKKLDKRSDLYSFGVMLYQVLTGHFPFPGNSISELITAHLFKPPLGFDESDPHNTLGQDVRELLLFALQKDPKKRIGSADEFLEALDRQQITAPLEQDLDQTLSLTIRALASSEVETRSGSTQDRIDREFGMAATPHGSPLSLVQDDEAEARGVTSLYSHAQQLADDKRLTEARQELYRLLAIDPDHTDAKEKLSDIEAALAEALEVERQRAEAIAAVADQVEEELRSEQLEEAKERLSAGREHIGDVTRFLELEAKIVRLDHELEERRRERAIDESLEAIGQYLEAEDVENAEQRLEEARTEFGELRRFHPLEKDIDRLRGRLEARRRRESIAASIAAVEDALNDEHLEEARESLDDALGRFGTDVGLQALEGKINELRIRLEERTREEAIVRSLAEIEESLALEDLEPATRKLGELAELYGTDPRLKLAEGRIEALRVELEERKRQELIAAMSDSIERLIAEEKLDGATSLLSKALSDFGEEDRLKALGERIDGVLAETEERERREEEARRRQQIQEWLGAAEELAEREDLEQAITKLEQVLTLDPDSETARSLLGGYQQELARREAERLREESIERAVSTIRKHLVAELVGEAELALRQASDDGDDTRLEQLARDLETLRSTLAERQRQVADIEAAIEAGSLAEAARDLEAALDRDPDRPELLELREGLDALIADAKQKAKAEKEHFDSLLAEAWRLNEGKDYEGAARKAREALALRPNEPEAETAVSAYSEAQEKAQREQQKEERRVLEPTIRLDIAREIEESKALNEDHIAERVLADGHGPTTAERQRAENIFARLANVGRWAQRLTDWRIAAAVGLVVVITAVVWWNGRPANDPLDEPRTLPVAETDTAVLVTAMPWARVQSVIDDSGLSHEVGPEPFTPFRRALPAGRYTIVLANPNYDDPIQIEVEILSGQTTQKVVEFGRIDTEAYFDKLEW